MCPSNESQADIRLNMGGPLLHVCGRKVTSSQASLEQNISNIFLAMSFIITKNNVKNPLY